MAETLAHRGPDARGVWTDAEAGVALGHRGSRSSICRRPAPSRWSRPAAAFVISYNGEVYNCRRAPPRAEARGAQFPRPFRHRGDRRGARRWGVEATVKRLIGMFAFALWDRANAHSSLVRDRLGIKPLYWARRRRVFVFGSELKALSALPRLVARARPRRARRYLRLGYVPAPHTHLSRHRQAARRARSCIDGRRQGAGDRAVLGRSREALRARQGEPARPATSARPIDALDDAAARRRRAAHGRRRAARRLSVRRHRFLDRRRADAGRAATRPVRTFSIGFHEQGYDEAPHATRRRATHLGTEHTELYVEPRRRARRHPATCRDLRRAVRRFLADPDLSRCRS